MIFQPVSFQADQRSKAFAKLIKSQPLLTALLRFENKAVEMSNRAAAQQNIWQTDDVSTGVFVFGKCFAALLCLKPKRLTF